MGGGTKLEDSTTSRWEEFFGAAAVQRGNPARGFTVGKGADHDELLAIRHPCRLHLGDAFSRQLKAHAAPRLEIEDPDLRSSENVADVCDAAAVGRHLRVVIGHTAS